jgi:hypothetical protein
MTTPTQTEPPFVPLRHTGWATKRTPLWVFAAIAAALVGVYLVSLSHKPSPSQRASDLTGYFADVNTGIGSCAAGLRDSMTAYQAIARGDKAELNTGVSILVYNTSNCEVATSEPIADFANYQVTESLASFHLDTADSDVVTWAFDATAYQQDMLAVLRAGTPAARALALPALTPALATLNARQAAIDAIWNAAKKSVGITTALPNLTAHALPHLNASGVSAS